MIDSTKRIRRAAALSGLLSAILLGGLVAAPRAEAHAVLNSSQPEDGATLQRSPDDVVLAFSEPIDEAASSIRVLDTQGRSVGVGKATTLAGDQKKFRLKVSPLSNNVYIVTWRVLSRIDLHVTGGTLAFGVGVSPEGIDRPAIPDAATPGPTVLSVGGRFLFYAGLVILIGAAWMSLFALARTSSRLIMIGAAAVALVGAAALAESQRRQSGTAISEIFGTSIGNALLWRGAPLAVAAVCIAFMHSRWRRLALAIGALSATAAIVGHVAAGHAAAGLLAPAKIAAQSSHFAAVSVWIGGLVALLIAIRGAAPIDRSQEVRRFSAVAGGALAVVVVTGIIRALNETGSWRALLGTGFGKVIIAKACLLLVLATLGAINRYRNVPESNTTLVPLKRISRIEVAVAASVLVLTGVMASMAPARTAAQKQQPVATSIRVSGSDFGTTTRVSLDIDPAKPGPNRFTLHVTDYDTRRPVTARRVAVTFAYRGRPDIQPSTLEFKVQPDGSYVARGGNVAVGGLWKATVLIERESTSVEIPLSFATRSVQRIDKIETPGQPTLYNVQLPDGGSVQFYVDPPRVGQAEVHATFFDASGKGVGELDQIVLVASAPDGTEPKPVATRVLTPGHFVADLTLTPGVWRFDVTATNAAGDLLWASFEESIK